MKKKKLSKVLIASMILIAVSSSTAKSYSMPGWPYQSPVSDSSSSQQPRNSRELELIQVGRDALLKLKYCEEREGFWKKQVDELKAANADLTNQNAKYKEALTEYEAARKARVEAEQFVVELRANYEKQLAVADKQLALEQQKARFNVQIGNIKALLVGAVVGVLAWIVRGAIKK